MPEDKTYKQSFIKHKPKGIKMIPIPPIQIDRKEDLRDLITDYIVRNMEEETKTIKRKKVRKQNVHYPTIPLKINVNGEDMCLNFQFVLILRKYLLFEKKNIYKTQRIEPLIVDILDFLDRLEEATSNISFQLETAQHSSIEDQVLTLLIEKHHKDKQKKCRLVQYEELKKKIIAKHTRISYIDIEDQLKKKEKEFLLQINQFDQRTLHRRNISPADVVLPEKISNIGSQLSELINNNQVFDEPGKLEQLKKEKILSFYKSNEMEYLNKKAEVMEDLYDGKIKSESSSIDKDCLKFIEDWISDISLSEKYFQSKYGRADKKIVDIDKSEIFIDDNLLIQ